jgi:membrane protein YqaA with SNARE-associated domain
MKAGGLIINVTANGVAAMAAPSALGGGLAGFALGYTIGEFSAYTAARIYNSQIQ